MASLAYKSLIVLAFFPRQKSTQLDVYVPNETNQRKNSWFAPNPTPKTFPSDVSQDSVSFGMSAIEKKNHRANGREIEQLMKQVEQTPTAFESPPSWSGKKRRARSR